MSKKTSSRTKPLSVGVFFARLKDQPIDLLEARLSVCLAKIDEFLAEAAAIVKILVGRDVNLKHVSMARVLLHVANNQTLPELVTLFIGSAALEHAALLPRNVQQQLVNNPVVPVVKRKPDGSYATRDEDLSTAPAEDVRWAVGKDGIRSPEKQRAMLEAEPAPKPARITGRLPGSELHVYLTVAERQALEANAAHAGMSPAEFARACMEKGRAFKVPARGRRSA